MLQSDPGNIKIEGLEIQDAKVLCSKEYNGILYIVAKSSDNTIIGTFPGVENGVLVKRFTPLKNLLKDGVVSEFITNKINISESAEIVLQQSFDTSINIILSDGVNKPMLINSGFYKEGDGIETNDITYNNDSNLIHDISLVKTSNKITKAKFLETRQGGGLLCGNYRFVFRYADRDGNESDIFAETQNINIYIGSAESSVESVRGGDLNENSGKSVVLMMTNLDTTYDYIKVYYERITSDLNESLLYEYKKIETDFKIKSGIQKLVISGHDNTTESNSQLVFSSNKSINSAVSLAQASGYLFAANLGKGKDYNLIRNVAESITVEDYETPVSDGIGNYDVGSGEKISKYTWLTSDDFVSTLNRDIKDGATAGKIYKIYPEEGLTKLSIDTGDIIIGPFDGSLDLNGVELILTNRDMLSTKRYLFSIIRESVISNGKITATFNDVMPSNIGGNQISAIASAEYKSKFENLDIVLTVSINAAGSGTIFDIGPFSAIDYAEKEDGYIKNCKCDINISGNAGIIHGRLSSGNNVVNSIYKINADNFITTDKSYISISSKYATNTIVSKIKDSGSILPDKFLLIQTISKNLVLESPNYCSIGNSGATISANAYSKETYANLGMFNVFDVSDQNLPTFDNTKVKYTVESIENIQISSGYYSEYNAYYKLGYWPKEFYKFAVSFIMSDGELSPAFELKNPLGDGVIQFGDESKVIRQNKNITPYGVKFNISDDTKSILSQNGIIGILPLRQKRIQNVLCNGLALNTTNNGVPTFRLLNNGVSGSTNYNVEVLFSNQTDTNVTLPEDYSAPCFYGFPGSFGSGKITAISNNYFITSPDIVLNSEYFSSVLNGSECTIKINSINNKHDALDFTGFKISASEFEERRSLTYGMNTTFIPQNCKGKKVKGITHRTIYGSDLDIQSTPFVLYKAKADWSYSTERYVRGESMQYVAVNCTGNIGHKYVTMYYSDPDVDVSLLKEIRSNDNSPYYAISDRIGLNEIKDSVILYGGDCFIGDFITRMSINYTDKETPLQDVIITSEIPIISSPKKSVSGLINLGDFVKDGKKTYNLADLNAARLGYWLQGKYMSNVNPILRSIDRSNSAEIALKRERGFYPYNAISIDPSDKVLDSDKFNKGYSVTCSGSPFFAIDENLHINDYFPTRIIYSKPDISSITINNYRVFEPLAYAEFSMAEGEIRAIYSLGNNLLVVFDTAVGLLPINERVLSGSGAGGDVYVTSPNVINNNIVMLNTSYGANNKNATIRSNFGVYGVDKQVKKIWRTNGQDFENISDFTIQNLLIDIIKDNSIIKLHYDAHNHIVYFNIDGYNLSYNENIGKFVGFHSWVSDTSCEHLGRFVTFKNGEAWKHLLFGETSEYCKFYGTNYPMSVKYVVNTQDPTSQKIYDNIKIISNDTMPTSVKYFVLGDSYNMPDELIQAQDIKSINKFGRRLGNAAYLENIVKIQMPSIAVDGKQAKIRNKYIGVELSYDTTKYAIIRSVTTLYNMSYV